MEQRGGARDGARLGTAADGYEVFVALVPQHMAAVLQVAAALVGLADAEDAAQEAIVRGWQAWPSLHDPAAMRPWLLRITVNVCRDWLRGRFGTRQRLTVALDDAGSGTATDMATGADPGASDFALALDLRSAINALDMDLRTAIALRYYAGMDATEIGLILNIPAPTVRTRLRRALMLLRERLGTTGDMPAVRQKGGR